ncbi:MAG: acyl-CoA dehydrogenase family protein [Gemmataceae bacterium]|nr:acyl-CoA dehydrogenase family protein [Gemmataceae bacterium]MCI0743749.1 acyl-CoA dehydrogenase family protein [Gemmataceae bacterium]
MALTPAQIEQQKKQAEELLFSGDEKLGFAKSLFFGHFQGHQLFPYPEIQLEERPVLEKALAELRRFADEHIHADAIDRNADIPRHVIDGLGSLGVLGMTAPREYGGPGFSQSAYCKIMELVGGHCSSTAVFVNAHHSIGIRALLLFGTDEQKRQWLPDLVTGNKLGAFALTEPQAGSDAANVQTTATPSPDGKHYILNGEKRYITNGGIAQMLTVMARTPVPNSSETKITAFLVTPDMPGFEVVEARMEKCGIRGTATARLAFHDMPVPAENILGPLGKGLKVALTVLDFGRTTFGASCTGAAKTCIEAAVKYANSRVQFQQSLGEFELTKKKIAWMAAHTFAMEAMTAECAAFIDRGADDYMLETAMLKVFSTEALWQIVNDTLQIHGGAGYFTNLPYERMMRDARINQIGEGANEVLKAFIAVVGMRGVGESLKGVLEALRHPFRQFGTLWSFGKAQMAKRFTSPDVPVQHPGLKKEAKLLAARVRDFGIAVQQTLAHFRKKALANSNGHANEELAVAEVVLKSQYMQERIADAACDLYAASCTLSRLDWMLAHEAGKANELQAGRNFLGLANRRIKQNLAALWDNDDAETTKTANLWLGK